MFINHYFSEKNGQISFTRGQASDFAKKVADDFNPLHDVDAKRFCVPGDLLFSVVLANYGLSQKMRFNFLGMVTDEVSITLPDSNESPLEMVGQNGKNYLSFEQQGDCSLDKTLIANFVRCYVEFSGHTFPHVLVPLMAEKGVMINPQRPMVMYESMSLTLDTLAIAKPVLVLDKERTTLNVDGKRGNVCLAFQLLDGDNIVGRGEKNMLLSGLRDYDEALVKLMVDDYLERKVSLGDTV